jgi:predicted metal-binding membrane protein
VPAGRLLAAKKMLFRFDRAHNADWSKGRLMDAWPQPPRTSKPAANTRALVARTKRAAGPVLALTLAGWAFLAWLVLDMSHPYAQLTMPQTSGWSAANALAIYSMWAVMMAAMMLPSALPMILTFVDLSRRGGESARAGSFVAAYLLVWLAFSAAATVMQWALQALDWVDPMLASTSIWFTGALLLIAGIYQFSPLKRLCLSSCRTPVVFLLGQWRPGVHGAFVMGTRHGLLCLGCCWALMALLFVGGVMNPAWIAALSIAVALEKLVPGGERLSLGLGVALIAIALIKWASVAA